MMALVLVVIFSSICEMSMVQVRGSASTSTGIAPAYRTATAHEMMVNVGRMTSSPSARSSTATAACNEAVPLHMLMPYCRPQYRLHFSSNSSINGPDEEIQPVFKHAATESDSRVVKSGSFTGITKSALFHPIQNK